MEARPDVALRAALDGPPASFVLDGDRYELLPGRWGVLWRLMQVQDPGWRLPLLWELVHPEDADVFADRLEDPGDELDLAVAERIAGRLVEQATGRSWWVAQRLIVGAAGVWAELDGALLRSGVDLARMMAAAPARACNLIYAWMVDGADAKERRKWEAKLLTPPPSAARSEPLWTPEEEASSFQAALARHGKQGGKAPAG